MLRLVWLPHYQLLLRLLLLQSRRPHNVTAIRGRACGSCRIGPRRSIVCARRAHAGDRDHCSRSAAQGHDV